MELNLHANATTTPKVRSYIQRSKKNIAELATELGVSQTTIRLWRCFFDPTGKSLTCLSSPSAKNIPLRVSPKSTLELPCPAHTEGRFAIVTDVGAGCGGR
jgi:hypothetical protein